MSLHYLCDTVITLIIKESTLLTDVLIQIYSLKYHGTSKFQAQSSKTTKTNTPCLSFPYKPSITVLNKVIINRVRQVDQQ